jgi:hypothetical protein
MVTSVNKAAVKSNLEPQSAPLTFLARCRAVVESVRGPGSSVPLLLKHRVRDFKPKASVSRRKNSLPVLSSSWNEKSIQKTEAILGAILIIVAILLLQTSEDKRDPLASQAATAALTVEDGKETPAEMPYLASTLAACRFLPEPASVNVPEPLAEFHSFTSARGRFSFNSEPGWKKDYLMSTQAACGFAQNLQNRVPHVVKRVAQRHPLAQGAVQQRISRHRLGARMISQARKTAFENYLSSHRSSPNAIPVASAMSRFRALAHVLTETCGAGPAGDGGGEN